MSKVRCPICEGTNLKEDGYKRVTYSNGKFGLKDLPNQGYNCLDCGYGFYESLWTNKERREKEQKEMIGYRFDLGIYLGNKKFDGSRQVFDSKLNHCSEPNNDEHPRVVFSINMGYKVKTKWSEQGRKYKFLI